MEGMYKSVEALAKADFDRYYAKKDTLDAYDYQPFMQGLVSTFSHDVTFRLRMV